MVEALQQIDQLSEGMQAFLGFMTLFGFIATGFFFGALFNIIEKYIDQKYPKK